MIKSKEKYDGPLLCGFNVAIKRLMGWSEYMGARKRYSPEISGITP